MAERRVELILRLPNLEPHGQGMRAVLMPLKAIASQLGGSLSYIERDHFDDGSARHVSRKMLIERRGR